VGIRGRVVGERLGGGVTEKRRKKTERRKNKHGDYNEFDNELYGTKHNL